jgi:hypothetical protein
LTSFPNATEKEAREHLRTSKTLAREKNEAKMIDAERKGGKSVKVTTVMKDLSDKLDKWNHQLNMLVQRRPALTGRELIDLIILLRRVSDMLMDYTEQFKAITDIKEYETVYPEEPPESMEEPSEDAEDLGDTGPPAFIRGHSDD